MPHAVGFVDDSSGLAHHAMLALVKAECEAAGWTTLRYDTSSAVREWIAEVPGYTGPDGDVHGYVGMRSYHDVAADYYNLSVAGFTGYVPANAFTAQPGYFESGVPAHNQRIDYWLTVNARRLAFGMKVGTPVYESAYAGFILPYASPRQYPYPLAVGGMLTGVPATRFSEVNHSMPFKGARGNFGLRWVSGAWINPHAWPWTNGYLAGGHGIRPSGTYYPLPRVVLHDNAANIFGELDGLHYMTGFDNAVENTITIGGIDYIVLQDVWRTGFVDYVAMRLDP